ncbi:TPA: hypothetical protein ACNVO8_004274 [Escherichia coli]
MNLSTLVLVAGSVGAFFLVLSLFMLARLREPKREAPRMAAQQAGRHAPPPKPRQEEKRIERRAAAPAPAQRDSSNSNSDGDFATSALIAGATNNAALGYLVGGSLTGALIGDALADTARDTAEAAFDPSPSNDIGGFDSSDSSSGSDW